MTYAEALTELMPDAQRDINIVRHLTLHRPSTSRPILHLAKLYQQLAERDQDGQRRKYFRERQECFHVIGQRYANRTQDYEITETDLAATVAKLRAERLLAETKYKRDRLKSKFQPKFPADLEMIYYQIGIKEAYGSDYIGTVRQTAGALLLQAIKELPQNEITETFPDYLLTIDRHDHTAQDQTILGYLFVTVSEYYGSLYDEKSQNRATVTVNLKTREYLALYLAERIREPEGLKTNFFGRSFWEWRKNQP